MPGHAPRIVRIVLGMLIVPAAATAGVSDPMRVLSVPATPRPAYLERTVAPTFGTPVERITGDAGTPLGGWGGTWGRRARHVYSKQQPWNADGTLLLIENRDGGSPSPLLLNGATFAPLGAACSRGVLFDYRWNPSPRHARELVNVNREGTELAWVDVGRCAVTRSWPLPLRSSYGIGSGEGNPSADGRFVALGNDREMVVVDMDPRPPHPAWPHRRIGPVYRFASDPGWSAMKIGNLSISPSGRYVDVKFSGPTRETADLHRIYEVDPATLGLRPHRMAGASPRCGAYAGRTDGWILPLKHADMTLDPFDQGEDVIVGGRSCPGSTTGHVLKIRLRDGAVTALTDPANEAPVSHVSTRSVRRPGWAYVSFYPAPGRRFDDELVAIRLDGHAVERLAHVHSVTSGCYACEAHPVPSPDGTRVLFASNWARACGSGCGAPDEISDFVVWRQSAPDGPSVRRPTGRRRRGVMPRGARDRTRRRRTRGATARA